MDRRDRKSWAAIKNVSDDEKRMLVSSLAADERQIYQWLREGFSLKWAAETLQTGYADTRDSARRICKKLHVRNEREIVRYYAVLDKGNLAPLTPEVLRGE